MALDPRYIPLYNLQQYFVDKTTGAPLSNGRVYFFSDENRSVPKTVYELSSTTGTYTYVPLPNPVLLSSVGTPVDVNGNDIVIYAFPFNVITGESELYYVRVEDSMGRPQLTREAVPSFAEGSTPGSDAGVFNYIPNGQFLAHTNVPSADNMLVAGSNIIAQGGFSIELSDPLVSQNTLIFNEQQFIPGNPPNSPRWIAQFQAVTFSNTENIKNIRIKFKDVNKFSSNDDTYTFCFWAKGNIDIPISIQIVKFCGDAGTVVPPETIFTDVINTNGALYQYVFQFGTNEDLVIDNSSNNDFVAIDIALPLGIPFTMDFTDFVLANGEIEFTAFPLQTDADMITRGVDGWTDTPNPDGSDLGLTKVLTREGYRYSDDDIGDIGMTFSTLISPLSTSPLPTGNKIYCDGGSYIYADYSTIGIPFSRLGDVLWAASPISTNSLFGTGFDYATAFPLESSTSQFILTANDSGNGISSAADGNTGWTIERIVTYGSSTTGSNSIGYKAYEYGGTGVNMLCFGDFATSSVNAPLDDTNIPSFTASTTNFTNPIGNYTLLGKYGFQLTAAAASTLSNPSAPGDYLLFSNDTIDYYMWYQVTNETDPAVGGRTGIQVNVGSSYTQTDVANVSQCAFNAFQTSAIIVSGLPLAGQYWTFQSNPGSIRNFYVWYSFSDSDAPPSPGGIGIEVRLLNSDDAAAVVSKTILAINKYQYAVPDMRGLFVRGLDPNNVYDLNSSYRTANPVGIAGNVTGTLELAEIISHNHAPGNPSDEQLVHIGTSGGPMGGGANQETEPLDNTANTGSDETRPVNITVNYYIRY